MKEEEEEETPRHELMKEGDNYGKNEHKESDFTPNQVIVVWWFSGAVYCSHHNLMF